MGHIYTMWQCHCGKDTRYFYCIYNREASNNYRCCNTLRENKNWQEKEEDWKISESQKRNSETLEL